MEGTARAINTNLGEMVHHISTFCFSISFQKVGTLCRVRLKA